MRLERFRRTRMNIWNENERILRKREFEAKSPTVDVKLLDYKNSLVYFTSIEKNDSATMA